MQINRLSVSQLIVRELERPPWQPDRERDILCFPSLYNVYQRTKKLELKYEPQLEVEGLQDFIKH